MQDKPISARSTKKRCFRIKGLMLMKIIVDMISISRRRTSVQPVAPAVATESGRKACDCDSPRWPALHPLQPARLMNTPMPELLDVEDFHADGGSGL